MAPVEVSPPAPALGRKGRLKAPAPPPCGVVGGRRAQAGGDIGGAGGRERETPLQGPDLGAGQHHEGVDEVGRGTGSAVVPEAPSLPAHPGQVAEQPEAPDDRPVVGPDAGVGGLWGGAPLGRVGGVARHETRGEQGDDEPSLDGAAALPHPRSSDDGAAQRPGDGRPWGLTVGESSVGIAPILPNTGGGRRTPGATGRPAVRYPTRSSLTGCWVTGDLQDRPLGVRVP